MTKRKDKARAALAAVPNHICPHCNTPFRGKKEAKFCSATCSAAAKICKVDLVCECGKPFSRPQSELNYKRAFCSKKCAGFYSLLRETVDGFVITATSTETLARNVAIVKAALGGMSHGEIGRTQKVRGDVVSGVLDRAGISKGKPSVCAAAWSAEEDGIIAANQSMTANDLAELLPARSPKAIDQRRIRLGKLGVIAPRTRKTSNRGMLPKAVFREVIGFIPGSKPRAPTIPDETIIHTDYNLPDPRHQCCYLYGAKPHMRQCQAVVCEVPLPNGDMHRTAWCKGHYRAVYRLAGDMGVAA